MTANDNPQALRLMESMTAHGEKEAGMKLAEEHPLARTAGIRQKFAWAGAVCAFLNERYDDETVKAIRTDCACGPTRGFAAKIGSVYAKERDPYRFAETINGMDLGFSLQYDGTAFDLIYPQCYCSCVKRVPGPLPRAWCYCTLGYTKRLFASIFGRDVRAELIGSIKQGDAECRIRITLP